MTTFIAFALLGIGSGAIYALAADGIVLIYRGSGVLNFAQGAIALVAAGIYAELTQEHGWATAPAIVLAIGAATLLGFLIEFLVMRRLRHASPLARLVAILGVLGVIESGAELRYGQNFIFVPSLVPDSPLHIAKGVVIGEDRFILLGIAAVVTVGLWFLYRYTAFGRWTTAVAENRRSASAAGVSPSVVAGANWLLGGFLAGVAGVLIVPITSLNPSVLVLLILPALAAAMVGNFSSFPLTLLGGVFIGLGESVLSHYVTAAGWSQSLPFLVIIVLVVVRGRAVPIRGYLTDRLPRIGMPKLHPYWGVGIGAVLGVVLLLTLTGNALNAMLVALVAALVALSVVVVTGLAGQLSLGQLAFSGIGGFFAARFAEYQGLSFLPALLCGVAVAVPVGFLFGLPALRTRGVNLAIVTLGLGFAIDEIVLLNSNWTGGYEGLEVGSPHLFGLDVSDVTHPQRYVGVALFLFLLCLLLVANLRRGRAGLRLMATRTNERAAASIGVSTMGAKLYAFSLSAGIAALAGVLMTFQYPHVTLQGYDPMSSIQYVILAFLGGIGFLTGSALAGSIAAGGLITYALSTVINFNKYEVLVTSAALVLMVLRNPDGAMAIITRFAHRVLAVVQDRATARRSVTPAVATVAPDEAPPVERCTPRTLRVENLTVAFGGVQALREVSLQVGPGEIVGLIGPNGAGKTTLIDAITGYNRPSRGTIYLDDVDLRRLAPFRRARRGASRTFQNVELFEDMTVGDNLRVACDGGSPFPYLADLVRPRSVVLPPAVRRAMVEFGLLEVIDRRPSELSFGHRRLLGVARAVASGPSILLLDEPAAGLDETETRELGHAISRLAHEWGIGVLLVEHDMGLVMSVSDRVVVLNFGERLTEGPPDEVRQDPEVVAAYLGSGGTVATTSPVGSEPAADLERTS